MDNIRHIKNIDFGRQDELIAIDIIFQIKIFNYERVATESRKYNLKLDKPIYNSAAVLDVSKMSQTVLYHPRRWHRHEKTKEVKKEPSPTTSPPTNITQALQVHMHYYSELSDHKIFTKLISSQDYAL
ncbi:hypothetical protein CHS0354_013241 [Potamilus streckersoni]|uniref:Uncharacterized protein n=1 Tax=Potamilus streckersoni TaxID=2493646 RepID=A0AAE0T1L8_9BIVA|nr:hypothetical protein CHS0354_013241 [Potamilus streckersoni]